MMVSIFCPQCDTLLLDAAVCAACGWQRPRLSASAGEMVGEPVPLGRPLSGQPALFDDVIWYAAPATSPETAGALVALHRGGSMVRRHELEPLLGGEGLPVATSVCGDGRFLYPGLLDYAFGDERPLKAIVALEPRSGRVAWQLATASRELSTPVVAGEELFVAGASQEAVYAASVAEERLLWRTALPADQRFQPAVTQHTVAVLAGPLTGDRYLVGLDRRDGAITWQVPVGTGAGQPVAAGEVVIVPRQERVEAYGAADGSLYWAYDDARVTSRGITTARLTVGEELLFAPVGAWDGDARAYALHALSLDDGQRCWAYTWPAAAGRSKVPPVLFGDAVISGNSAGDLVALDRETGELLWRHTLPQRLVAAPALVSGMLLLPGRDGHLFRLHWQEGDERPAEEPAIYEATGEWEQAAVAHALAELPDLAAAGRCLMRASQPSRALQLYTAAADDHGAAEALAAMGQLEAALKLLPQEARAQRAAWYSELGRHDQAGELYAELEQWEAAAEAFEAAHRPLKAVRAYHRAGLQEDVVRLAAQLDLEAVEALVDVLGWEAAVARYKEAGQLAAAADMLEGHALWEDALALRRQEGNWERVLEICRQLGDWEGEAEACLTLADALPRREVVIAAEPFTAGLGANGLPEQLYASLRAGLLSCEPFASDPALDALFVDARIAPWRRQLGEARTDLERVDGVIALLHDRHDSRGRNGLVLLVEVLGERYDQNDERCQTLHALHAELATALNKEPVQRVKLLETATARQWRAQAADLYAAHERWTDAERCYRAAGYLPRWAEAVARQGRWEEAGDLLSGQRIEFEQAAAYYWEAAAEALAAVPQWERRAPTAATLFHKAQECFLFSGNLEGMLLCRTEADRCQLRPRLVLGEGELRGELQQGVTSQFTLPLYNVGFGPAATIEVFAYGSALKRPRDEAVWAGSIALLAADEEKEVEIAVEPSTSGHEELPLQIKLLLRYRDVRSDLAGEDGPFEIHQPVLPAAATARPGRISRIRPHHQGYYFDTREQVEIARAARGIRRGERDVTAVLDTMPMPRPVEQADG
ncbi:MAG: PQQ-binding-like beta-propeller repeat protein [Anaerolineae bacterium]|nr:PQQ-binding-like beta-propeller repeat protein [Anaerolineae bacterium]